MAATSRMRSAVATEEPPNLYTTDSCAHRKHPSAANIRGACGGQPWPGTGRVARGGAGGSASGPCGRLVGPGDEGTRVAD